MTITWVYIVCPKWIYIFYFKCTSTWTLHIVVFDMTWHHVMLSCLNKPFGMTLMTIYIQSNAIINLIINEVFFPKILLVIVVQYVCTCVCIHLQCVRTSTMTIHKSSNLHYSWFPNCNLQKDYVKSLKQVPSLSDAW
jgi:hypothetical protein